MTPFAWTAATLTAVVAGWLVSTSPREAPPLPPSHGLMTPAAAAEHVERELVAPMRERDLGLKIFSRVGPTVDARSLRAVMAEEVLPNDAWIRFRVEVDRLRGIQGPETRWLGRIDRASGAIELAPGTADAKAPIPWRPMKDALPPKEE